MPNQLAHVDPTRPAGPLSRASAAFANTGLGRFLSRHVVWKVDPWLMRVSGGRLGMGFGIPTALLETTGARSGEPRANGVIYFHDGERVTIVASKLGLPENPAWFHNLRAHPDVILGGVPMRAEVVSDEAERGRLWALADNVFAPYAQYRAEAAAAGREIPIVQLRERALASGGYPVAS
jgi:deazaflavin-dependent oxidoreductase (nitroreductase family)